MVDAGEAELVSRSDQFSQMKELIELGAKGGTSIPRDVLRMAQNNSDLLVQVTALAFVLQLGGREQLFAADDLIERMQGEFVLVGPGHTRQAHLYELLADGRGSGLEPQLGGSRVLVVNGDEPGLGGPQGGEERARELRELMENVDEASVERVVRLVQPGEDERVDEFVQMLRGGSESAMIMGARALAKIGTQRAWDELHNLVEEVGGSRTGPTVAGGIALSEGLGRWVRDEQNLRLYEQAFEYVQGVFLRAANGFYSLNAALAVGRLRHEKSLQTLAKARLDPLSRVSGLAQLGEMVIPQVEEWLIRGREFGLLQLAREVLTELKRVDLEAAKKMAARLREKIAKLGDTRESRLMLEGLAMMDFREDKPLFRGVVLSELEKSGESRSEILLTALLEFLAEMGPDDEDVEVAKGALVVDEARSQHSHEAATYVLIQRNTPEAVGEIFKGVLRGQVSLADERTGRRLEDMNRWVLLAGMYQLVADREGRFNPILVPVLVMAEALLQDRQDVRVVPLMLEVIRQDIADDIYIPLVVKDVSRLRHPEVSRVVNDWVDGHEDKWPKGTAFLAEALVNQYDLRSMRNLLRIMNGVPNWRVGYGVLNSAEQFLQGRGHQEQIPQDFREEMQAELQRRREEMG